MSDTENIPSSSPQDADGAEFARKGNQPKKVKPIPNHPPVKEMVLAAIKAQRKRKGSSLQAIKKYIAGSYNLELDNRLSSQLRRYVRRAVNKGDLMQTRGRGAVGSFKVVRTKPNDIKIDERRKNIVTKSRKLSKKPISGRRRVVEELLSAVGSLESSTTSTSELSVGRTAARRPFLSATKKKTKSRIAELAKRASVAQFEAATEGNQRFASGQYGNFETMDLF